MELRAKVFVVTGGGNGIGREVVLGLLARGAQVAAVDVSAEALAETAALVTSGSARLSCHTVDITDRAAVEALPDRVVAEHGQVDGLLNVAGIIQRFVPFAELTIDDMDRVLDVNLWGVIHTTKAFLPLLMARPSACIVNVSSMGGLAPVPGQTVYGASKAAVKLLTEGLYSELRETNVAVTVVFPGGVSTSIAENSGVSIPGASAESEDAMAATTPASAAEQIIEGIRHGSFRVVIGKDARMLDRLSRLAPKKATDLIAKKMKSLLG